MVKQHKLGGGVKNRKQKEIWSSNTNMEIGNGVKKHMQEDIWSSSASMEMVPKSTSKKRYGQAAQAWRWGLKAHARRDMVN
jgi:hypothetical protein